MIEKICRSSALTYALGLATIGFASIGIGQTFNQWMIVLSVLLMTVQFGVERYYDRLMADTKREQRERS